MHRRIISTFIGLAIASACVAAFALFGHALLGGEQQRVSFSPIPERSLDSSGTRGLAGPPDSVEPPPIDVLCPETVTLADCYAERGPEQMNAEVKGLFSADFVYNRVEEMWRDQPTTVVLKIVPAHIPGIISPNLPGSRQSGKVSASRVLSASLRGSAGLVVTPTEAERRQFSAVAPTTWQWLVTPTPQAAADNLLTLTIYAQFDNDTPYTVAVYEDVIHVKVGYWQYAKEAFEGFRPAWAFVVAVVPALWAIWTYLRRSFDRRRRRGFYNPPPPPAA